MVQQTRRAAIKTKQAVTEFLAQTGSGPGRADALRDGTMLLGKTLEAISAGSTGTVQVYAASRVKDTEVAKGDEEASGDTARQYECYSRGHAFSEGDWCLVIRAGGTGMEILPFSVGQCDAELTANLSAASSAKTGATTASAKLLVADPDNPGDLKDGPTITVTNRSLDGSGLSGDYIIVGRIGEEWRPIWIDC